MGSDTPKEQRFEFTVVEGDRFASGDQQVADVTEEVLPLPTKHDHRDEPATEEDHAAELKRRVAQLRSTARRSSGGSRPARPVEPKDAVDQIERSPRPDRPLMLVGSETVEGFDEGESDDEAISIASFYERVRRALANEFTEEIWVAGEIRGLREGRGHRYLELADKGVEVVGRGVAQQLEVVCWARDWPPIARQLKEAGVDLEVGRVVRVRGKVSVWEGGSKLRFTLTALDVEALLGGIAAARHRLLATLAAEDLLEANRRLVVPIVPLRVGIVTSPGSEAHRDFVGQLERSGYAFDVRLEASLVQGSEAPSQIAAAFGRMRSMQPDIVVLVRGGGARGDLAAFDSEEVARAIATAPFPVWTGIGHTSDRSVADEVASRALITPTACGEAIVDLVNGYWSETVRQIEVASRLARGKLDHASHRVSAATSSLVQSVRHQLSRRSDGISATRHLLRRSLRSGLESGTLASVRHSTALKACGSRLLAKAEHDLVRHRQVLNAFDPARQLERGWSLAHDENGRIIRSSEALKPGDRVRTRFYAGGAVSVVERVLDDGSSDPGHDK